MAEGFFMGDLLALLLDQVSDIGEPLLELVIEPHALADVATARARLAGETLGTGLAGVGHPNLQA